MEKILLHNLEFRTAKLEDLDVLCELLFELFSQEVEFIPNKEVQEKALKTVILNENIFSAKLPLTTVTEG